MERQGHPSVDVTEHEVDNGYIWTSDTPEPSRKEVEAAHQNLTERTDVRMENCCICGAKAIIWVREIRFLFPQNKRLAISSADYSGPVPGFCVGCGGIRGPEALAKAVYMDKEEAKFTQPTEWVMEFTDSTKVGGPIISILPNGLKVEAADDYKPGQPPQ